MHKLRTRQKAKQRRTGLAMLELVLSLPIMLFVMGLMIIFGAAGSWKVRTLSNSRQAVWRTFSPRTGDDDPIVLGFRSPSEMSVEDGDASIFDEDPFAEFPVVRGPQIVDPQSGQSLPVRQGLLDITVGLVQGHASIERGYPVLSDMPPGRIDFVRKHAAVDGRWQFWDMGLVSNRTRRVRFMYPIDLQGRMPDLTQQYVNAALAIGQSPNAQALNVLDQDDELRSFYGRYIDYHARVGRGCTTDTSELQNLLDDLVPRINPGVPQRMTRDFIKMYETQIANLQAQLDNPLTPPGQQGGLQGQIEQLQTQVDQLRQFQSTLSN